ncbi:ferrous-iron efflux pump FieF [Frischella perrara]|uniref:Cation-efflux pump FieF n=1 Tax=Frischella perrara TaxID=1267021 RepID=A0A0A7RZC7_FRIPE|nr:cation diffusion facilitator family transporter [Frischella perrara]AJA43927.1 cation diffusion facilitator family transporter [Frischella perrara]PWV61924.1 ferrous-iron efflux pump FieF [Frischella perrara]
MNLIYDRLVKRSTTFSICFALLLIAIKFVSWWITDSYSLLVSLFDSSMDFLASGLNFILIRYALKPPDDDHLFGHGKAESLAALAQSAFIIGSVIFLLFNSIKLVIHPTPVNYPIVGIIISSVSTVLTFALVSYQRHVIKLTGSNAIEADMLHYSADLLMNIAVIIALSLSWIGIVYADGVLALLIGGYIFFHAIKIMFVALQDLLDKALPESDNQKIYELAMSFSDIHGVHDIKTRRSGPITFVQLHIELDDNMPLVKAHAIADKLEKMVANQFSPAEVIVHQDPISVVANEKVGLQKFK